ncbi:DUF1801 domain-containing protein [Erythrobacter sp. BLCC-B19]|uniref:DUF1801 domain-containing protein n=1 Tax=Erythrobacter sp. BLCC-B19 TaxID=3025315 RepID=UPI00236221A3|nr:DUF1801 domain-containing protein [Erythrobacter sp. BLCC-B19]WDA40346.1 DUF1801 domain-containing protein [Erythrobacter sp. BLCC-B19]
MAEAKTKITEVTVEAFLEGVEPPAKREEGRLLDALFRKVTGEVPKMWGPTIIGYGQYRTTYESGRAVHWMRTGFSPRKAKHSLYFMGGYCDPVTGSGRDEKLMRLGKYTTGKSCLYVNKLGDIDLGVLEEIIAADWAAMMRLFPES